MIQDIDHVGIHTLNHFEQEVEDNFLSNSIIKDNHNQISLNFVMQSSYEHLGQKEIVICDDQKKFLKDQGGYLFSRKGENIYEQSIVLNHYECDLDFEDLVASLLEFYLSDSFQFSDFIMSLSFDSERDLLKEFVCSLF
jgi:hypothetical protein